MAVVLRLYPKVFLLHGKFILSWWIGPDVFFDKINGGIDNHLPSILQRLGIQSENWIDSVSHFHKYFFDATGTLSSLEQFWEKRSRQLAEKGSAEESVAWIKGKVGSKKLYG